MPVRGGRGRTPFLLSCPSLLDLRQSLITPYLNDNVLCLSANLQVGYLLNLKLTSANKRCKVPVWYGRWRSIFRKLRGEFVLSIAIGYTGQECDVISRSVDTGDGRSCACAPLSTSRLLYTPCQLVLVLERIWTRRFDSNVSFITNFTTIAKLTHTIVWH
jgi:hypothetical protein